MIQKDLIIIGSGPVGIFAAFQAGMLGMKSVIIDALDAPGGQCTALYPDKPIYDIPGYPEILAKDLIHHLQIQASRFSPEYIMNNKVCDMLKNDNIFTIVTNTGIKLSAPVILIAAGCGAFEHHKPPINNIQDFENTSIFYSVSDKSVFANKRIVITGGGDSAVDWAINLSEIACKIYIVHRRDKFRAAPESITKLQKLVADGVLELVTPYQLHALSGENGTLKTVTVIDFNSNERLIDADFLLPFFGLKANLGSISHWGLELDMHHIIVDKSNYSTSIPGIYAVGDVAHYPGKLKLILTGFAEVATALHHAYPLVFSGKALHFQHSTTILA